MGVVTLATVGYGDFTPKTDAGKLFTVLYVLIGVGILLSFVTRAGQAVQGHVESPAHRHGYPAARDDEDDDITRCRAACDERTQVHAGWQAPRRPSRAPLVASSPFSTGNDSSCSSRRCAGASGIVDPAILARKLAVIPPGDTSSSGKTEWTVASGHEPSRDRCRARSPVRRRGRRRGRRGRGAAQAARARRSAAIRARSRSR